MIEKAWNEVSKRTLNSSWKQLWPAVVTECDFEDFGPSPEDEAVDDPAPEGDVEEIISLGRSMGLVVDEADVDNLIEEHREELTTEALKELEAMQVSIIQEEQHSSGGEEVGETEETTSAEIREAIGWYENLTRFIEKKTPRKSSHRSSYGQC